LVLRSFLIFSLFLSLTGAAQDRNLDYYLEQGLTNSPVLKDYTGQIEANSYDSLVTRAGYLPQVNFNGLLMYAPVINGWGYSEAITNGQNLIGTVNVNQPFFNKKTREATLQKYGIQGMSLENSRKISVNELKKAITAQYLAVYSAYMESSYLHEVLSALYDEEKILNRWVEQGIYRQTDLLSLRVEIMNLESNAGDLSIQYRKEFTNLNLICGIRDTTLYNLILPAVGEGNNTNGNGSSLFMRFYYDSLQIQNEKLVLDRKYKPTVSWFSDAGIINSQPEYLYQNFGLSIGLSMNLPIYDGNQRKYNYGRIRTMEETRKNYEEYFRFQYSTQMKQLRDELNGVVKQGNETDRQVALVMELVKQDKILLSLGSLPITDYVLALKNLTEARHRSILYRIRAQYILNEINFLKQ
jgi:outer membrane protein TolC